MIKNTSLFVFFIFISIELFALDDKKVEVTFSKEEQGEYLQRRGENSFKFSLEYYTFSFADFRSPINSEIFEKNYQKTTINSPAIALLYAFNFSQTSFAIGVKYVYNKLNGVFRRTNESNKVTTQDTKLDASMLGFFAEFNLDLFSDYYVIPYGEIGFNQVNFTESIDSNTFSTTLNSIINFKVGFKARLSALDSTAYRDGHREHGLTEAFLAIFANQQSAGSTSSVNVASSFQPGISLQLEY